MCLVNAFLNNIYKNKIKSVFLIDILYMKDINSVYGFKNGNFIIKQLHFLLKNKIKKLIIKKLNRKVKIQIVNAYVDVFKLTIFDDLNENEILDVKNIIFKNIVTNKFNILNNQIPINLDVTIGLSKGKDKDLQIYAEKALHIAKMNFTNFMYYDSKLYKNHFLNEELLSVLHRNINEKLVEPFLQPIYNNKTEKIEKYEALIRIFDNTGKVILPDVFINKARKYRVFNKLMEILILKVINYIKEYNINISINLDYIDIVNPSFKELLINKLKETQVGKNLTIEILESRRISNYYLVNDFINDLKAYDVKIAIDDFGSGFSNYEHILNINTDYIKLDGSLIKKIDEEIYHNLIKSIVLFCKEQNIKTVAEFVGDLKIQRYVKSLDIDYSQGYYIGKPQPINELFGDVNEG